MLGSLLRSGSAALVRGAAAAAVVGRSTAPAVSAAGLPAPAKQSISCGQPLLQAAAESPLGRRLFSAQAAAAAASPAPAAASLRDFAIIAHVDHGKTTLMDRLLKESGATVSGERVMDSMSLEVERGITIASKYTSFQWNGITLNAVDTPGHADFGGEVERVLDMVDGALLLVDAAEGPLAQTKFVLAKALKRGLLPLVLLNKVDRPEVTEERCKEVTNELFELFDALGASDEQLDFPVLYSSSREGWASRSYTKTGDGGNMSPLLNAIVDHIPCPQVDDAAPFSLLVTMIERDPFVGRIVTGRIASGSVRAGDALHALHRGSATPFETGRVTKLLKRVGMTRVSIDSASAGDIVQIAGLESASVTDTIASPEVMQALPSSPIDPPTISMTFGVNDSPLAGRDGTKLTGSKIGDWLLAEAETNVSINVKPLPGGDAYAVQGRGELQLGVVLERMRREGFELSVSPPAVLYREENGKKMEPIEEVVIEVEDQYAGTVIESITARKGDLLQMAPAAGAVGKTRLSFLCPSRGLIGYRSIFTTETHGTGVMHRAFHAYEPVRGQLDSIRKGVLVSMARGPTTAYALASLEARGELLVDPQVDVYDGMIVGIHSRDEDLQVNPVRAKQLTNIRAAGKDDALQLRPPKKMTLEEAIGFVWSDELIEITPRSIRLRKKILDANVRKTQKRRE